MTRHDKRMTPAELQPYESAVAESLAGAKRRVLNAADIEAWLNRSSSAEAVATSTQQAEALEMLYDEVTNHGLLERLAAERAERKANAT